MTIIIHRMPRSNNESTMAQPKTLIIMKMDVGGKGGTIAYACAHLGVMGVYMQSINKRPTTRSQAFLLRFG